MLLFLLLIFFSLTLVFWPPSPTPFEIPKVLLFKIFIEIFSLYFLFQIFKNAKWPKRLVVLSILAFTLITVVSSIFGANLGKSLWGNYWRDDGLFTLFHLIAFTFILLFLWKKEYAYPTSLFISLSSFFLGLISIFQVLRFVYYQQPESIFEFGIGSIFGQPVFLGGYLLVALPFTVYLFQISKIKKQKIFFLFNLLLQIASIILSTATAAIGGIFLALILLFFFFSRLSNKFKIALAGVGVAILLIVGFYFWQQQPIFRPDKTNVLPHPESRERILTNGVKAFEQRPILGWGWSNFEYAFNEVKQKENYEDLLIDKAHSHLLELFVTTGILGVISYILLFSLAFYNLFKKPSHFKEILATVLILFIYHSQTNVISINEELLFWFVIGVSGSSRS